jgi:prepilin-type N-terminal cleavage/methylation domain-containing protein
VIGEHRDLTDRDAGFTLIELLVYVSLLGIIITVISGIFLSSLTAEKTVRTVVQATTQGQLAAQSVQTGIRNSTDFRLQTYDNKDQLLLARVAGNQTALTYGCAAWYYSASERTIRYKSSTAAIAPPTAAQVATWLRLVDGVVPATSSPATTTIFVTTPGAPNQLDIAFEVNGGATDPNAAIVSSAVRRLTEVSTQCF